MRVALVVALLALPACRDDDAPTPMLPVASYAAIPARELDVLVQMDNSNNTADFQAAFADAFPGFLDALAVYDGALPDLHLGVITSDLGTTTATGIGATIGSVGNGGCADAGDDGALKTSGAALPEPFIIDEDNGGLRRRNYTGSLADTFGVMARVGATGCGFEQPLAATVRAFTNDANVGFFRPAANLLVLLVADEDDCSAQSPALFDPPSAEIGPLDSFRCTRFGLTCEQDLDTVGDKTACVPRDDSPLVSPITPFVDALLASRDDPARIAVAAIVGPPDVAVEERSPPGGGTPSLALTPSCVWSDRSGPSAAEPAVRLAAATAAFAPNSAVASICNYDFASALADVSRAARGLYGITCLPTEQLVSPPACSVTVESPAGDTQLSLCPAEDCFEIIDDPAACGDRPRLVVHLAAPAAEQFVRARCAAR